LYEYPERIENNTAKSARECTWIDSLPFMEIPEWGGIKLHIYMFWGSLEMHLHLEFHKIVLAGP
jgi:hypothetical protein